MSTEFKDYDLEQARECYFASGGVESDIGPRNDPTWYWRRAAKNWRRKVSERIRAIEDAEKYY